MRGYVVVLKAMTTPDTRRTVPTCPESPRQAPRTVRPSNSCWKQWRSTSRFFGNPASRYQSRPRPTASCFSIPPPPNLSILFRSSRRRTRADMMAVPEPAALTRSVPLPWGDPPGPAESAAFPRRSPPEPAAGAVPRSSTDGPPPCWLIPLLLASNVAPTGHYCQPHSCPLNAESAGAARGRNSRALVVRDGLLRPPKWLPQSYLPVVVLDAVGSTRHWRPSPGNLAAQRRDVGPVAQRGTAGTSATI